jgi:hypothetical protein
MKVRVNPLPESDSRPIAFAEVFTKTALAGCPIA